MHLLFEILPVGLGGRLLFGQGDPPTQTEAGDDAQAITLDGSGHFEVIVPGSTAWADVRLTILGMFER